MPTRKQLHRIWATEFEYPQTRRTDDPMYTDKPYTDKTMHTDEIDKVKKYWNDRPCNIRHSTKEVGTKEYFDEVEARKYMVEPHIPAFAEFEKWKGKSVLEIGCGIGTDAVNFARNGANLFSVDLTPEAVRITRERLQVFGLDAIVEEANAETLTDTIDVYHGKYADTGFDLIYSFGVLHHTPDYKKAFREIAKIMQPKTELRMMVYHKGAFKTHQILEEYDYDYAHAEELVAKHSEAQTGCPVTYTFTPNTISEALEEVGMVATSIEIDHIFPYRIEQYKKYEYVREDIWQMPDETFKAFEKRYGWHLLIKAKLK